MRSSVIVERGVTFNAVANGTRYVVGLTANGPVAATGNIGPGVFLFEADDFVGTKLRLIATCIVNDVAPVSDFTIAIAPVTAVSGGAAVVAGTIGSAIAATSLTFTAPAANSINRTATSEFNLLPSGLYIFSVVNSATGTANSSTQIDIRLEARS